MNETARSSDAIRRSSKSHRLPRSKPELRDKLCAAALAIGRELRYENAGTVEFLVDADTGEFYFIEVNPRIQVEHTVTEEVTGIDIVKSQILVAEGLPLSDPEIGLGSQEAVATTGFAVQCRVTTEDPANNFMPDHGRITHYRSASGMGIRLDAGTAFSGTVVTPYYDSLLVKVTARGRRFVDAARRMERSLQEFRVRGVKVNVPFLIQLMTHPQFLAGTCTTTFIDNTPELFRLERRRDRATRLLLFLADTIVNGNPLMKDRPVAKRSRPGSRSSLRREATDSRGEPSKAQTVRSRKTVPMDAEAEGAVADGYHVSRRAPIAVGHTFPHPRSAERGRGVCAVVPRSLLHRNVGRSDVRHVDAVPEGVSLAAAGRSARKDSQYSLPDAAPRLQRRRVCELSG